MTKKVEEKYYLVNERDVVTRDDVLQEALDGISEDKGFDLCDRLAETSGLKQSLVPLIWITQLRIWKTFQESSSNVGMLDLATQVALNKLLPNGRPSYTELASLRSNYPELACLYLIFNEWVRDVSQGGKDSKKIWKELREWILSWSATRFDESCYTYVDDYLRDWAVGLPLPKN